MGNIKTSGDFHMSIFSVALATSGNISPWQASSGPLWCPHIVMVGVCAMDDIRHNVTLHNRKVTSADIVQPDIIKQ